MKENYKKKVAIVNAYDPFFFKGGIETYISFLIDLLKSREMKVDIYHSSDGYRKYKFHNDYLSHLYNMGRSIDDKNRLYDFIIANAFYGLGLFPPKAKIFNVFHLTHIGFSEAIKHVSRYKYAELRYLWGKLAESVSSYERIKIAVSESVREELEQYYGIDDVTVIPNSINTLLFSKKDKMSLRGKFGIPTDAFVGMYVGRWDIFKGCDIIEEVIKKVKDIYWVVILGTGSDRNVVPRFNNVMIFEEIKHHEMPELYSVADFLLFPSRYEGFGYVILEAMACELVVITSNVGIAKTIYKREPFKDFLLPDFSEGVETIVDAAIERIAHLRTLNLDKQTEIRSKGRKIIEDDYSIDAWEKRMVNVMDL